MRWLMTTTALVGIVVGLYVYSAFDYWAAGHLATLLSDHLDVPTWLTVSVVNLLTLMLIAVMILATLLTLAERKWSAMMQDRIGPNRARIGLPGLKNRPLAGIPHVLADSLKMLTKEGFVPDQANRLLYQLAPVLNFAPVFCLFAIVPCGPEINVGGSNVSLQVAHLDFGLLYVFALASLAVYGTALAGWASNNKLALLGGVRATSQMISYEVALGLSLVGMMMASNSVRLDSMVDLQAQYLWSAQGWDIGLPAWGIFLQPLGFILFFTAAFAETKRAPFDLPEGESEIIGYFVEYSGMGFGMFMITEFVEIVVLSAITTSIFLGGYHLPFGETWLKAGMGKWFYPLLPMIFWMKVLFLCWVQLAVRWSFPRFRYDQIQRLGWQMLLPLGLVNVFATGALILWDPSLRALAVVGIAELAVFLTLVPAPIGDPAVPARPIPAPAGAHGGH